MNVAVSDQGLSAILAYKTRYGNLFFVVYDCGYIRDIDRFIGSFEAHEAVSVRVVKH